MVTPLALAAGPAPGAASSYANGASACGTSPTEYVEVLSGAAARNRAAPRVAVRDVPVFLYENGRRRRALGQFRLAVLDRAGDARATIRAVTGMGAADRRFSDLLAALSGRFHLESHALVVVREPKRGIIAAGVIDLAAASRYALVCAGSSERESVHYDVRPEQARGGYYRVPLRFIAEVLGASVAYHPHRVDLTFHTPRMPTSPPTTTIKKPEPPPSESPCPTMSIDTPSLSSEVGRSFTLHAQQNGKEPADPLLWGIDQKKLENDGQTGGTVTLKALEYTQGVTTVRVWVAGRDKDCGPGRASVAIVSPSPTPSPPHSPETQAGTEITLVPLAAAVVYNEFSPGNQGKYDPAYHAAYAFPHAVPWVRVSLDYTQYRYVHTAALPLLGGIGTCPSSDASCVTLVGHKAIEPRLGVGQYFIGSFTAIDRDVDARLELRATHDWYVVGGYTVRNFAHLGYPLLRGIGFGVEKLERPARKLDLRGSLLYYPNVGGTYTYRCITSLFLGCGALSGTSTVLSYHVLKYDVGATVRQGTDKNFILIRAIGDYGLDRTNAPSAFNHSRFELGYGLRP